MPPRSRPRSSTSATTGRHPQPVGRARALHRARGRGLPAVGARPRLRASPSRSVPSSHRPTPSRRPRSGAASGCPAASSRSSRASRSSTTPRLSSPCAPRSPRPGSRRGVAANGVTFGGVVLDFAWASVGGVAIGVVVALVVAVLRRHFSTEPAFDTVLSFMVPFAAYVPAEELHASGVIAVVTAGLVLGHKSPRTQSGASRLSERINWEIDPVPPRERRLPPHRPAGLLRPRPRCEARRCRRARSRSRRSARSLAVLAAPTDRGSCRSATCARRCCPSRRTRRGRTPSSCRGPACAAWSRSPRPCSLPPDDPAPRRARPHRRRRHHRHPAHPGARRLPGLARRLDVRGPDPREDALQAATVLQAATRSGLDALDRHGRRRRRDATRSLRVALRGPAQPDVGAARAAQPATTTRRRAPATAGPG